MSESKTSKLSAFEVYSSSKADAKAAKHGSTKSSRRSKKMSHDPGEEIKPKSAPKSLITMVTSEQSKKKESSTSFSSSKRPYSSMPDLHSKDKDRKHEMPMKSLLDISFEHEKSGQIGRLDGSHSKRSERKRASGLLDSPLEMETFSLFGSKEGRKEYSNDLKRLSSSDRHESHSSQSQTVSAIKPLCRNLDISHSSHQKAVIIDLSLINVDKSGGLSSQTVPEPRSDIPISLLGIPRIGQQNPAIGRFHHVNQSGVKTVHDKKRQSTDVASFEKKELGVEDKSASPWKKRRAGREDHQHSERIKICEGKDFSFLIVPSASKWLHLHGRAKLTVVKGVVTIMAYTLLPGVTYDVYSPATGCLLAMQVEESEKMTASEVVKELKIFQDVETVDQLKIVGNETIAIIKVQKLDSSCCDYLTSFIPYTQLFNFNTKREGDVPELTGAKLAKLGLKVAPQSEMRHICMNWSVDYNNALDKWSAKFNSPKEGPVLITCGAKNSGKSLFNRCAINIALQRVSEVAFLDCDVGQTEFSPPATLSLHILSKPVLEPPFCHQRHAERMVFYGDISPSQDPSFYMRCLHHVFKAYTDRAAEKPLPLIVNTMGFPEGIGFMLFIDTMNIVKPDLVVQIDSFAQYSNFPAVTQELVALDEGWTFNKHPPSDVKQRISDTKEHELVLLTSLAGPKRDFSLKLQPVDLRNLALLSALSMGLDAGMTLTSAPPYQVPYKHLAIHVCHHRLPAKELLMAVDTSVVALCVADLSQTSKEEEGLPRAFEEPPVCDCLGLGFVRGLDTREGVLLVITTLPRVLLRKVNTILKGALTLPDQLFLKQKSSHRLPYVGSLAPSTAVAAVRPRSRLPRGGVKLPDNTC